MTEGSARFSSVNAFTPKKARPPAKTRADCIMNVLLLDLVRDNETSDQIRESIMIMAVRSSEGLQYILEPGLAENERARRTSTTSHLNVSCSRSGVSRMQRAGTNSKLGRPLFFFFFCFDGKSVFHYLIFLPWHLGPDASKSSPRSPKALHRFACIRAVAGLAHMPALCTT